MRRFSLRPMVAILMLLLMGAGSSAAESILIVLRHPEGPLRQRLASASPATVVPEEVRAAAEREETSLVKEQQEAFDKKLAAAGAKGLIHYPDLNMVRADLSQAALVTLRSDPAVVSVTSIPADAPSTVGCASSYRPRVRAFCRSSVPHALLAVPGAPECSLA